MAYSIVFYPNKNLAAVLLSGKVDDRQITETLYVLTKFCNDRREDVLVMYNALGITELLIDIQGLEKIADQRNSLIRTNHVIKLASVAERSTDIEIARLLEHYRILPETNNRTFTSLEPAWEYLGISAPAENEPYEDLTTY